LFFGFGPLPARPINLGRQPPSTTNSKDENHDAALDNSVYPQDIIHMNDEI